jgi:hypothetical protein
MSVWKEIVYLQGLIKAATLKPSAAERTAVRLTLRRFYPLAVKSAVLRIAGDS